MTAAEGSIVQKTITVQASPARAFEVFTAGIDAWWPRSHHIGKSPMKKVILEGRPGGRCYTLQEDGTDCDWGKVLAWEPPHRFLMAWQITHLWGYEPDLAKSSEVEVVFTAVEQGKTRVDVQHRYFERMGPGGAAMRTAVDSPGGWGSLLEMFASRCVEAAPGQAEEGQGDA
jgi:uncharacterized protein YndB with AHSA1/START domain